jgi:glycosyltransferase involved in cell wall biosynthesis
MPNADKKRVLHAISLDHIGGVEVLFHAYLAHADRRNLEHHVLLLRGRCHPLLAPVIHRNAASVSLAKYRAGIKLPRTPKSLRRSNLLRIIRDIRPDVTLIHNTPGNPLLWDAAANAGGNILYYEHGGAWRTNESGVPDNLKRASHILCNSHAARRMLELRWGLPVGRACVNRNPLRPDVAPRLSGPKPYPSGRRVRLGVAGRLALVKGFSLAIHLLRRLPDLGVDAELLIAGDGPERRSLQALARQLNLSERVHLLGHVADVASFYDSIDLFLCPSLREPLGNVCIEAAARGCPIVCTQVDGLPEIVRHGETGLCIRPALPVDTYREFSGRPEELPSQVFDPSSDALVPVRLPAPESLAEAVAKILQSPDLYAAMSEAACRTIAEAFRFDRYVAEMNRALLS